MEKKIVIIGAGIAGLSAGCYSRMNGYSVEIYESHALPGGLCTSWKKGEYTIDGCLHWLTGSSPGDSIIKDPVLSKSIPFMPESSVKWCFDNEKLIKASIITELNDTTFNCLKKFIADGPVSTPPPGFVEKTGYFAGYRIIEACIKKGMKLEEICSLNSDTVLVKSGYFN